MAIQKILEEFKTEVKRLYGRQLKNVILYGSWARGDATQESDIDLLIVLDKEVILGKEIDRTVDIITDINLKYGVLLSAYPISIKDYASTNSPLFINIRREGVPA